MNAPQVMTPIAAAAAQSTEASEFERLLQGDYKPKARDFVMSSSAMDKMYRFAEIMAKGTVTTPEHLRNKLGDCFAIVMQAMLWGMDPFAVAQKTHIVSGKLGYEAQLVNAVLQQSGAIVGAPRYEFDAKVNDIACRVGCVLAGQTEVTWNEWHWSSMVVVKNSPLWKTNVRQQMAYLQLKNWTRLYAPGAILGVTTVDDLLDVPDELRDMPPAPPPGPRRRSASAPAADAPPAAAGAAADPETGEVPPPPAPASAPAAVPAQQQDGRPMISEGQVKYLRGKLHAAGVAEQEICQRYEAASLDKLSLDAFDEIRSELLHQG